MPYLRKKTKMSMDSVREKKIPRLSPNSAIHSENPSSQLKSSSNWELQTRVLQPVNSSTEAPFQLSDKNEASKTVEEQSLEGRMEDTTSVDNSEPLTMKDYIQNGVSNLETIFSPLPQLAEARGGLEIQSDLVWDAGQRCFDRLPWECDNCDSCFTSGVFTSFPFEGNCSEDWFNDIIPLPEYVCAESNFFIDMGEECTVLPFLEDNEGDLDCVKSDDSNVVELDRGDFYFVTDGKQYDGAKSIVNHNSNQVDDFDPLLFIRTLPDLSGVISNFHPAPPTNDNMKKKGVTLVLDLDETLIHSTLEHQKDADFTISLFFNMKEYTMYVKQRPYLHVFLEKVSAMFEVIIFTASEKIYAAQLLDKLDPDAKFISHRAYRDSCILRDGIYTKDLTVLGVDLARVAIVDNFPKVFRFQVNNGIPIKTWEGDSSDDALMTLLPFLEILSVADDVRPIIAKRFGNKE